MHLKGEHILIQDIHRDRFISKEIRTDVCNNDIVSAICEGDVVYADITLQSVAHGLSVCTLCSIT